MTFEWKRCRRLGSWRRWSPAFASLICLAVASIGCGGKSAVSQLREGTPAEAAAKVMTLYDGDRDGKLTATELAVAPGLVDGLSRIDSSHDGVVDVAEMTARFVAQDELSDVVPVQIMVTNKGTPLDGAVATMTPDPCMGEGKQTYEGKTANGLAQLVGTTTPMPTPTGYYTLRIVDSANGVDLTRGYEVAEDGPSANRLTIDVAK
jgi:hypothetical protein